MPLDLNWGTILRDEEPATVEIVERSKLDVAQNTPIDDALVKLSDFEIQEKIMRSKRTYRTYGKNLPDNGEKLMGNIQRLQAEFERRKTLKVALASSESAKPSQSTGTSVTGAFGGSGQRISSPRFYGERESGKQFSETEEKNCRTTSAFKSEFSFLAPDLKISSEVSQKRGRGRPRKSIPLFSSTVKRPRSIVNRKGMFSSTSHSSQNLLRCFNKTESSLLPSGSRPPKEPTYLIVDEDEPELMEMSIEEEDEFSESMEEAKIYYPSSEDPEAIQIFYPDIKCLAPESYLSSTIMNFYISFLQEQSSSNNKPLDNYHFFNTYFYNKLQKAVSYKGSGKEAAFVKFRRWWRGVNIFEKAYIFIPLHDSQHWSLVIICMPDKEDGAGPIVLHLDSLEIHNTKAICDDIKSYLVEEWKCVNQKATPSVLPFADWIWESLPRRISGVNTTVPRQKNDYDCGLFVLYFMERFIQEAPEKLKRKDLDAMFGKNWFEPKEASGLRRKIRTLLKNEFKKDREGVGAPEGIIRYY